MADKQMQFNIEDGPTFYSDEISITNNALKFFLDFKNSSPRVDVRSNDFFPVAIKHSAVIIDPVLAKQFSTILAEHVKKYEKEHGKIPEPQPQAHNIAPPVSSKDEKPGYFG